MSAEAIARLRKMVASHDEHAGLHDEPDGSIEDLRALLDAHATLETAHTEALDAFAAAVTLLELAVQPHLDDIVRAFLAKAGRR